MIKVLKYRKLLGNLDDNAGGRIQYFVKWNRNK